MKICIVCSHGGHLTEMLQLMEAFEGHAVFFITYDSPRTRELKNEYLFDNLGENLLKLLSSLPRIFRILHKERPHVIVSTGAEIAIPVFYIAKLLRIKTIFIESWCRVNKPSITGKIVYPIADVFLVQWKELLKKYGKKARHEGGVF
jgi:UDP-N-acetylglucosamine:LPS N-acetylglucosamine transferase